MLEEKILADYKQAMKNRDRLRSSVLSFLRSSLKNLAIDKRKDMLSDEEVISVIKKQIKQREDSIEQFKRGGRTDLSEKETKEKEILESYLPEQLGEEKIRAIVDEIVVSLGGTASMVDMGKVMKEVMAKVGASSDGKIVSSIVKDRLQKK
ncbi:MAG: GatB/YqeY domain-containing protein [Candidatus Omnitrophota bacterium]